MARAEARQAGLVETLREGVRVEADRHYVRFLAGRFEGRHRWPDYTAFIEPELEEWERASVYRLWVQALNATHFVPFWARPVIASQGQLGI